MATVEPEVVLHARQVASDDTAYQSFAGVHENDTSFSTPQHPKFVARRLDAIQEALVKRNEFVGCWIDQSSRQTKVIQG
ncbi:MAG: hypothetical protein WB586_16250 [Chthoniobacterales bacterium]